jgi:predicted deacylase
LANVRDIEADVGQKAFGYITVGETSTYSVNMPVAIVHGEKEGPVLCLTAGIHGCEYPGIEAAIRTYRDLDPAEVSGTVIFVPVVNTPAFQTRTAFVNPLDGQNLNRICPGNPEGTISFVMLDTLFSEILSKADYLIDLHGGDLTETMLPWTLCCTTGNAKIDQKSLAMAKVYGTNFVCIRPGPGLLYHECSMKRIPAIIAEAGGLGTYHEQDILVHTTGIANVLKFLKIIDGSVSFPENQYVFGAQSFNVSTKRGGILYPKVGPGDFISKGQIVAEIGNLQGEMVEKLVSPKDGVVRILYPRRVVETGAVFIRAWLYPEDQ